MAIIAIESFLLDSRLFFKKYAVRTECKLHAPYEVIFSGTPDNLLKMLNEHWGDDDKQGFSIEDHDFIVFFKNAEGRRDRKTVYFDSFVDEAGYSRSAIAQAKNLLPGEIATIRINATDVVHHVRRISNRF